MTGESGLEVNPQGPPQLHRYTQICATRGSVVKRQRHYQSSALEAALLVACRRSGLGESGTMSSVSRWAPAFRFLTSALCRRRVGSAPNHAVDIGGQLRPRRQSGRCWTRLVQPAQSRKAGLVSERRSHSRCTNRVHTWEGARYAVVVVVAVVLLASGCGLGPAPSVRESGSSGSPLAADADRPTPGGPVVRGCGSHYATATDFDAGMGSRTVSAGTVSLVGFRVSPIPDDNSPVRTFKMMVRLEPGTMATVSTTTHGTSLLYDRARFRASNVYQLGDGEQSVRFVGCRDQSAVFNGAVLTTGPEAVDLQVEQDGQRITLTVHAYNR